MVHNTRSPEQLAIITKHVNFRNKRVIDFGCGYGDILRGAILAGASYAIGVDEDKSILNSTAHRDIVHIADDVELFSAPKLDIAISFSVLPYLAAPMRFLRKMKEMSSVALIECQYAGDGPGYENVTCDGDMKKILLTVFDEALPIGKTKVEYRGVYRTIWMCK